MKCVHKIWFSTAGAASCKTTCSVAVSSEEPPPPWPCSSQATQMCKAKYGAGLESRPQQKLQVKSNTLQTALFCIASCIVNLREIDNDSFLITLEMILLPLNPLQNEVRFTVSAMASYCVFSLEKLSGVIIRT